jgi:DNA-binding NarL/FixJ family response regulator
VVAGDELFRRRIRELLADLRDVRLDGEAVDGIGATIVGALTRFDVAVIDADLPPDEAHDLVRRLRAVRPGLPIVGCSTGAAGGLAAAAVVVNRDAASESGRAQIVVACAGDKRVKCG